MKKPVILALDKMLYRSRVPLRLGLAGGGTDVSPYSDLYGGAVLNATINLYVYTTLKPRSDNKIILNSVDTQKSCELVSQERLIIDGYFPLHKGTYNKIIEKFIKKPLSFELSTFVEAPIGSGLGTSSALVVAIVGVFVEWLKLPLGEYDIAQIAHEIERVDLKMVGGKQDQYSATFGGVNFMEFHRDGKVIINPLRIKQHSLNELEFRLVLYYTQKNRVSSQIIQNQAQHIQENKASHIEATHKLKEQALLMKEALLRGNLDEMGKILDFGWQNKKKIADNMTSDLIDNIYQSAIKAGASGGKISGAGGGGFMIFYCPENNKFKVIKELEKFGGITHKYHFTQGGLEIWTI